MTVIVGVKSKGKVYIGSDSAITYGNLCEILVKPKVFRHGKILMGFSGFYRDIQLARVGLKPPKDTTDDPETYLVTQFIPKLKKQLKTKEDEEIREDFGGIIAYKKHLFHLDSVFSVSEVNNDFVAEGSGGEIARGVLIATRSLPPEKRIKLAIEAACKYDIYCKEPIIIKSI